MKYHLTIDVDEPTEAEAVRRLRAFLKAAWRSWRIKAVAITESTPEATKGDTPQ